MTDLSNEIQKALVSLFDSDPTLSGLGVKMYDMIVPENALFPYIAISDITNIPFDVKEKSGGEIIFSLNVWDQSRSTVRAKNISARIKTLLHQNRITTDSAQPVAYLQTSFTQIISDGDNRNILNVNRYIFRYL